MAKEPQAQKYPRIIIIYILYTCFNNTNWLTPSTVALHCEAGRAMSTVGSAFEGYHNPLCTNYHQQTEGT